MRGADDAWPQDIPTRRCLELASAPLIISGEPIIRNGPQRAAIPEDANIINGTDVAMVAAREGP